MAYNKAFTKKAKPKSTTHICSECIEDFAAKDLFVAQVPDRDYTTIYCAKCLKELGITVFHPYHKVAEKKVKVKTEKTIVKTSKTVETPKRKYVKKTK